jgi:hypothetical protein
MTLDESTTIINPDDKLTVTVFPVLQGYMTRMTDDDSGNIVGQRIFPNEQDAINYARRIAGVTT